MQSHHVAAARIREWERGHRLGHRTARRWAFRKMYEVGGYEFSSRAQAKKRLSEALNTYRPGDRVDDSWISGLLTALAHEHPRADEKIGKGIEYWVVCSNSDIGSPHNGFRAKQIGREGLVEFGFGKVIYPKPHAGQVAEALTQEALDITRQYRTDAFKNGPVICADTGDAIVEKTDAKAIHRNPNRAELHSKFLASEKISCDDVVLVQTKAGQRLADRELARRWCAFQRARIEGLAIVKIRRAG